MHMALATLFFLEDSGAIATLAILGTTVTKTLTTAQTTNVKMAASAKMESIPTNVSARQDGKGATAQRILTIALAAPVGIMALALILSVILSAHVRLVTKARRVLQQRATANEILAQMEELVKIWGRPLNVAVLLASKARLVN